MRQHVTLSDGRVLDVHDAGPAEGARLTVIWHHGSPQTGALLDPLVVAARDRGIRLISYARPGYAGSTPRPGRDVASAAADVAQLADAVGVGRFATMGASGGGPHALACAALLPERVTGVACLAAIAPRNDAFAWYEGMASPDALHAAEQGPAARVRHEQTAEFDESSFTGADWAALAGPWSSLAADAGAAGTASPGALIDDDLALVAPWGFALADVAAPVLLVQGGEDRVVPPAHAEHLLGALAAAELWLRPRDGHVSVLAAAAVAMDWLVDVGGKDLHGVGS